jgi:DNA-directed RNA polymerase subunit RPC12/RpoP
MIDAIRLIRCNCGRSLMFLPAPLHHCPGCHTSWREKKLTALIRCPHCGFNLMRNRQNAEGRTWGYARPLRRLY